VQREFLESVLPSGTVTIWRRASYGPKAPIDVQKWYSYPEDFEQILSYVEENSNWDVYVSPASYTAESRALENVSNVHTLWLDADTFELSGLRVEPTWKVQSSPGRWQAWWVLDEEVSATDAAYIVKKISYAHREFGADVSSWAANKLMRVPGSVNSNHGFPVPVTADNTGLIYSLKELADAYDDVEVVAPRMRHASSDSRVEQPADLPGYMKVLNKLPRELIQTVTAQPKEGMNRSDLRYRMLCDLFRFGGLTYDEILSVAWHAPASKKWSEEDPRGINGLKFEADKAQAEVEYEQEKLQNTPRPEESKALVANVKLVTDVERIHYRWDNFIEQYMAWAGTKTSVQNPPYDYMNAWTCLALMYGNKFYIPYENTDQYLNLYTFTLGQTTSGKSQAKTRMMKVLRKYFEDDPDFNLGGNMSPEALAQKLLDRDENVSFINKDEVHGWLKTLVDPKGGYQTGLVEDFAELYDGYLPPVLRKSMKGDSGKSARVCVTMHMMGTPEETVKVLTRDLYKSGFLARFIWAIGQPRNVTKKSLKSKIRTGARAIEDADAQVTKWAADAHMSWAGTSRPVDITNVIERLDEAGWELVKLVPETDPNYDILNPSLTRLADTIKKAAALLCVADGRDVVEEKDVLYTLVQAETWAANLISIGSQISASEFEVACDEIENFVSGRPDKRVSSQTLYNRFKARNPRDLKMQIESLEARGILLLDEKGGKSTFFINQNSEE
jgi:hypothetical protein